MAKKKKKRLSKKGKRIIWLIVSLIMLGVVIYIVPKVLLVAKLSRHAAAYAKNCSVNTFKESKTTIVYDNNNQVLTTLKSEKDMYYVDYKEIPQTLKDAFVVMEDRDFFNHSGVDYKAIMRAVLINAQRNTIAQGASTITQQLAKNIFLGQEVTWERKIEEMFLARDLEKKFSKEQILEFYLNNIYFGNGLYGVEAAARGYFGKTVSELTMSEQAFIAAIPNNPSKYNPYTFFDATLERSRLILHELSEANYISTVDYYTRSTDEIELAEKKSVTRNSSVETYVRFCATEKLMEYSGFIFRNNFENEEDYANYSDAYDKYYTESQQKLYRGGYVIYTSIDPSVQTAIQKAVDDTLQEFTEIGKEGIYELQSAATIVDNSTGNVCAIVGSRSQDFEGYTLNRAYQSFRQPGSCIKPLSSYTPFLQKGNTPDTIVVDSYIEGGPRNTDGTFNGNMTVREAVSLSKNTIPWKICIELTPQVETTFLINMRFRRAWLDKNNVAASIGGFTQGVTTVEMASAYAAIRNGGMFSAPTCVRTIQDTSGNTIINTENRGVRVYEAKATQMMTDILKTVVDEGTASKAKSDGISIYGKTGTTNDTKDSWFCGFTHYYTGSVWIGYDYPKEMDGLMTGRACEIFKQFIEQVQEGLPDLNANGQVINHHWQEQETRPTETESQIPQETTGVSDSSSNQESLITTNGLHTTTVRNTSSNSSNSSNNGNSSATTTRTPTVPPVTNRTQGATTAPHEATDVQATEITQPNNTVAPTGEFQATLPQGDVDSTLRVD